MKDLHSHICYGIDDGSKSFEESMELLKTVYEEGITDIILTPHYMIDTAYNADNRKKKEIFNKLQKECKNINLPINLYLGNEIYICDDILDLIKKNKVLTLNDSKYILIEFSMFKEYPNTKTILKNLLIKGYVPVIAHPERYSYIDKHLEYIKELVDMGCLLQGNYQSLFGKYGSHAQKMLKKMLKKDLITFLGSDVHHKESMKIDLLKKKLKRIVKKEEKVNALLENNIDRILKK